MFYGYLQEADQHKATEPVFVMLTHTGTTLSNLIKKFTGKPYSHASISFDPELATMYSMGRKKATNMFQAALVKENIRDGLYKIVEDTATYSMYVTFVSPAEKKVMQDKLEELISVNAQKEIKYDFIGLFYNKLNIARERSDAFFCSSFVATILEAGKEYFNKHYSLVQPYDFAKHKGFKFVAKGLIKNYNSAKVIKKVDELRRAA